MSKFNFEFDWTIGDDTYCIKIMFEGHKWKIDDIRLYKVTKWLKYMSYREEVLLKKKLEEDHKIHATILYHLTKMLESCKDKEVNDKT